MFAKKSDSELGSTYGDGEVILRQGEQGNRMYVIQAGQVDVIKHQDGRDLVLGTMGPGDFFGEMSLFQKEPRAATIIARGEVRVITVDKRTLLRRIKEDPLLAYNMVETMANRIRELHEKLRLAGAHVKDEP